MRELTLVHDWRPLLAPPPVRELEKCEGEVTAETTETGDSGGSGCGADVARDSSHLAPAPFMTTLQCSDTPV